jgi:hypothetical protein
MGRGERGSIADRQQSKQEVVDTGSKRDCGEETNAL